MSSQVYSCGNNKLEYRCQHFLFPGYSQLIMQCCTLRKYIEKIGEHGTRLDLCVDLAR